MLYTDAAFHLNQDTLFYQDTKYSGYIYLIHSVSSDTTLLASYMDGLQSGITKKWYDNKQLMEERHYCAGKKNGKQISFWENGNKRFEFTAFNDAYTGMLQEWNISGQLIHQAHFVDGQEDGEQKMWYQNGKIRANYVIIKGRRYGLLGTKNCKNVSDSIFIDK